MALIDSEKVESVLISSIKSPKAAELRRLLDEAYDAQQEEKKQKGIKDKKLEDANKLRRSLKLPGKIESDLWTTVYKVGARETIKKEKLVEAGVAMDVIDACTDVTPFVSFYIQGRKTDNKGKDE